jgi:methylenetetrahydrofolate dehydrogenase (NADP+)/methenyltetrahydrofolate cyclohydrolase
MTIIDGNKISAQLKAELKEQVEQRLNAGKKRPHLAAILVGNDGASETYIGHKVKACEFVGFKSTVVRLSSEISENQLIEEIQKLNTDKDIDGIIVQLPLPKHISEERVIETISPQKDVDGFTAVSAGKLLIGQKGFVSATPAGIVELIERYHIPTAGKHCVVLGRSNIVGKPMAVLMSRKGYPGDATVTICHSKSENLSEITKSADILIVALGIPNYVTADMVKVGAVVIDVGITRIKSDTSKTGWEIKGDVNFEEVSEKCSFITPVPGGVGPMTIVSLLKNTLEACSKKS